jgi:hypothetical protein
VEVALIRVEIEGALGGFAEHCVALERSIRLMFDSPARIPLSHSRQGFSCHREKAKMALLHLVLGLVFVIFIVIITYS